MIISICLAPAVSPVQAAKLRIISLAPSATEILFALGLDDEIVGVSQFCDYPAAALAKERVGAFSQPNLEKILALKPDIIICTGLEQAPVITKLKQLGLNVCVSDPSDLKELFESIIQIGALTGRKSESASLIRKMKGRIEKIYLAAQSVPLGKRPRVFIEIWHSPLSTAGRSSFIDEIVTLAGGSNIAHDCERPYSVFSAERVIKSDPEYIFLAYMNKSDTLRIMQQRVGWQDVSAIKNGRVYSDINPDLFLRPGPRLVDGLEMIHERLYK